MTKEEHENLLKEIANSGGDTANMLKLLQRLRDDFDEREGMLKRYGEERDKERPQGEEKEYEKLKDEAREDDKEDGGERRRAYGDSARRRGGDDRRDYVPRDEYERLRREYIDRFFSSPREADREQDEDIRKDDKADKMTFEELFKDREGD